jgi:hypothetical protein
MLNDQDKIIPEPTLMDVWSKWAEFWNNQFELIDQEKIKRKKSKINHGQSNQQGKDLLPSLPC